MVVLLAYFGVAPRMRAKQHLRDQVAVEKAEVPIVNVTQLKANSGDAELTLPSTIQAIKEASLSARTTGYLSQRFVDIGYHVKAGEVLATIDAPEVDQQLSQAQADASKSVASGQQAIADVARLQAAVAEAKAQLAGSESNLQEIRADLKHVQAKLIESRGAEAEAVARLDQAKRLRDEKQADLGRTQARLSLANKTYTRWKLLAKGGAVSGQDLDEAQEGYESAESQVAAARADVASADADVIAAQSSLDASRGNVSAAIADVASAREKVDAAKSSVTSSQASVSASAAAVRAGSANVGAANAAINSSEANVGRMASLRSFEKIVAPFDGVITARNVDVGDLISPPSGGGSGNDQVNPVTKTGLFGVAWTDVLRVQVNVPEAYVSQIQEGQPADVSVAEYPGRWFPGKVFHLSGAVDAASRMELVEIRVVNSGGLLKPGMFSQVRFGAMKGSSIVQIPATAMIFDTNGTRVAVVTPENKIHYVQVKLGRDFGDRLEVLVGLKGDERVVTNPDDSLQEGAVVRIAPGNQS